ncbi:MAG: ATP-dependent zinc metalloprotease FtsH [Planctomycetes bacterium]|nr:ATP-dependent zinc metalloprotease FtsH [Planctomycetota bacterium]
MKRNFIFLMLMLAVLGIIFYLSAGPFANKTDIITFETLRKQAKDGIVKNIIFKGNIAEGEYNEGYEYKYFRTDVIPDGYFKDSKILEELTDAVGPTNITAKETNTFWYQAFLALLPALLIIGVIWFLLMRQVKNASGPTGVFSFGRSRARMASKDKRKITFADVAGIEEAREEVTEIIAFLKDPKKFQRLGARIPRGVVLIGPPGSGKTGTGKTLLAKAVAGEAAVPFFSLSGSDFVEMFVGVGASRVRDLFKTAKENAPCIIFLDEIDAVGRHRGTGLGGGHDEREQTLNAILVEMDGFDTDTSVILIAATNRPDVLDPALLRPGRFDRQIVIDLPDIKGREAILKVHALKIKISPKVNLSDLAKTTPMFSGADLEAIINESALLAVMRNKDFVELEELEEARDKVRWGKQKRSRQMAEEDKKITAYHEAGHALLSYLLPEAEKVHKVTIVPRGVALGSTMTMPEKDRYHMQKKYALAEIKVLFGGRISEELFCNDISAGARSDIRQATNLARMMVCEWGMSEKLGPISYTESEEHLFLGREITRTKPHSETTAIEIDNEIKLILTNCYEQAKELIAANKDSCDRLGKALLKYEILSAQDVDNIVKGIDINNLKNTVTQDTPAPAK